MTGNPSEVFKLEREKSFFSKIYFPGGRDLKKNHPACGSETIFFTSLASLYTGKKVNFDPGSKLKSVFGKFYLDLDLDFIKLI